MRIFVLTKCVSGREKCEPSCGVFSTEQAAREEMGEEIKESIRECTEKYEVNPTNIEPKNNQGAMIFRIHNGTYAWKIKAVDVNLNPGNTAHVLLHAHNGGCVAYAESRVFKDMGEAREAMTSSYESALEMWRLMKGKTLFKNVETEVQEDAAKIWHETDVEAWKIVPFNVPA